MRFSNKGQSLAEYAICLSLVVAALTGMQVYVKRGLQARYKTAVDFSADFIAGNGVANVTKQYEPYYVEGDMVNQAVQEQKTTYSPGGEVTYDSPDGVQDGSGKFTSGNGRVTGGWTVAGYNLTADDGWK